MPKSKPTQVIVHRIELQEKERDMIEPFLKAREVQHTATSAAYILGAGAVVASAYVLWWSADAIVEWSTKADDFFDVSHSSDSPATAFVPRPFRIIADFFKASS